MKQLTLIFTLLFLISPALAQIDYSSKTEDQTPFRRMFDARRIADKKAIWFTLTKAEQVDARRANFTWGVDYLGLNDEQIQFLSRFSAKLPSITTDEVEVFEAEARTLFQHDKSRLLFGSIGPFQESCGTVKVRFFKPNCWCAVGSSFNMSCDDSCAGGGSSCNATEDGCGFAWLYGCNGICSDGIPHNDLTG